MKKKVHLKIRGKVQGVWYRASTQKKAEELNIKGWVKNDIDGGVSVVAEGEGNVLEELIKWCRQGPPGAIVEEVEEKWDEYSGEFSTFEIRY